MHRFLPGNPYNFLPDRIFPSTEMVGVYNAMRMLEPLATLPDDQAHPASFGQSDCKSVDPRCPKFDYAYKPNQAPFAIQSIYHDDKSTYIKTTAPNGFSIYEIKDGKPSYIRYRLCNGTYILSKVIDSGYIESGKERMEFTRDLRWLSGYENPFYGGDRPPLWLSAIGRSGFWPVALLEGDSSDASTAPTIAQRSVDPSTSCSQSRIPPGMFPHMSEQRLAAACILLSLVLFGVTFCAFSTPVVRWPEYSFVTLTTDSDTRPADTPAADISPEKRTGTDKERRAWIVLSIILCYSWITRLLILDLPWGEFWHDRINWLLVATEVILFFFAVWLIKTALRKGSRPWWAALLLALTIGFQVAIHWILLPRDFAQQMFYLYRSEHLLSGVSPVMPFICLFAAFILLVSRHIQALLVFSPDWRPRAPCHESKGEATAIGTLNSKAKDKATAVGTMNSKSIELIFQACSSSWRLIHNLIWGKKEDSHPLSKLFSCTCILLVIAIVASAPSGFQTFERPAYSILLMVLSLFIALFLLYEIVWVVAIWGRLRHGLLIPLERSPLRVCFSRVAGFSWRRLWLSLDLSLHVRYKPLSRAHDSADYLRHALCCPPDVSIDANQVCRDFQDVHDAMKEETSNPSKLFESFKKYQMSLRDCANTVIESILLQFPHNSGPLATRYDAPAEVVAATLDRAETNDPMGASAEEFVGLIYIHAIQHVLIDIRSHILAFVAGYLFLILALNVYPVGPHHTVILLLSGLFILFVAVILLVFTQMHRDSILSRTTNTESGKLGLAFYEKLIPVIGVPLIGLLASLFPEISNFLFSWLEPSLQAIK